MHIFCSRPRSSLSSNGQRSLGEQVPWSSSLAAQVSAINNKTPMEVKAAPVTTTTEARGRTTTSEGGAPTAVEAYYDCLGEKLGLYDFRFNMGNTPVKSKTTTVEQNLFHSTPLFLKK
jgi:hypothetical protein